MSDPARPDTRGAEPDLYDSDGFAWEDEPFPFATMLVVGAIGAVFWAAVGYAIASWAGWLA